MLKFTSSPQAQTSSGNAQLDKNMMNAGHCWLPKSADPSSYDRGVLTGAALFTT